MIRQSEFYDLLHAVANIWGVSVDDILSKRRPADVSEARQVVTWVLRKRFKLTLHKVAALMGGRHHTSTVKACNRLELLMDCPVEEELRKRVRKVVRYLAKAPKEVAA